MELKPGYKETNVGVIPEDWETKLLPEVSWFQEGPGLRHWQFTRTGMKVINVTNLENGVLNLDRTDRHISIPLFSRMYQHFAIDANDIVMASSGNSYSKTAIVREQDLPLVMNTSVIRFKPQKLYDYGFLWAILNAPLFKNQIDLMITGGAQPNFGPYHLKRINVPVPPLPEQRAIATALSDVDALLDGFDRLIAKKRDLKQAAMQQLLTGKTRLPGFEGEWEVKRLGNVFSISAGKSKSAYVVEGGNYWVCDMGSVSTQGRLIVSKRTNYRGDFLERGDLVMPKDDIGGGNIIGKVGYIDANDTYILGDHVYCLRALEGDPRFLAYVINSHRVNSELRKKVIGSAQLGLGRKSVNEQEIQFPQPSEQTAIATALSDMDAEITALEQRRAKTKDIKQAMMQELLTGKTRLVTPGGSNV